MSEYYPALKRLAICALISSPFFIGALFSGVAAPFLILAGAIVVAHPIAAILSERSGNLFYTGEKFDRPPPAYSIPQAKRQKGLYEEAIQGFEKIAADYPEEVQPYIEIIDIAIVNLKDPDRANAVFQRGIAVLKNDSDKEALARVYSAIRSRLNAKPSNK